MGSANSPTRRLEPAEVRLSRVLKLRLALFGWPFFLSRSLSRGRFSWSWTTHGVAVLGHRGRGRD